MYLPKHFKEEEAGQVRAAIREARLGTLVSLGSAGLVASHVPMLLEDAPAPHGLLIGHLARANPQWLERAPGEGEALAMFLGPDAYITPAWYETKRQTGKVVPTWNYVAVHAYGRLSFFEDAERLLALVTTLTRRHEGPRDAPWAVSDAPADFIASQLKGIVGFQIEITRLEGKWKMSQNRPAEDRAGVVEGLRREGGPAEAIVADIVAERDRKS